MRFITAVGLAVSVALGARADAQAGQAMTVIVVRHAEKAAVPGNDPPLSDLGEARAKDLYEAVKDAHVGAIVTTQYARTKATAAPTAAALSLPTDVVSAGPSRTHPAEVAAAVKKHAGKTVLVVGHSNTVPEIVEALGAKRPEPICDSIYDNLYVVSISANGTAGVIQTKFGARTPPTADCGPMMKQP